MADQWEIAKKKKTIRIIIKMICNKTSDIISESIVRTIGGCFLDTNNVLWKLVNEKWIGKRSVWTYDYRACWLEDTTIDNVKSWWCGGVNADYTEILTKKN